MSESLLPFEASSPDAYNTLLAELATVCVGAAHEVSKNPSDCGACDAAAKRLLAAFPSLLRAEQPEDAMPGFTAGGYYDAPTNAICVKPCGKCCCPQDCAEAARCLKQPQQAQDDAEALAQFIAGWCEQHPGYEYNQLADAIVARSKA